MLNSDGQIASGDRNSASVLLATSKNADIVRPSSMRVIASIALSSTQMRSLVGYRPLTRPSASGCIFFSGSLAPDCTGPNDGTANLPAPLDYLSIYEAPETKVITMILKSSKSDQFFR